MTRQRLAAIDIGTNSIRCIIDQTPDTATTLRGQWRQAFPLLLHRFTPTGRTLNVGDEKL
ncbi:MAG: hypothetical protein ACSLFH_10110 [Desulfuromonadales bacterium]